MPDRKNPEPLDDDEYIPARPTGYRTDDEYFEELTASSKKFVEDAPPVETKWLLEPPIPELSDPIRIGRGEVTCNVCGDEGGVIRKRIGLTYGQVERVSVPCECQKNKAYHYIMQRLPLRDRERRIRFHTLAPDNPKTGYCQAPMELQKKKIAQLKANYDTSFLMLGPAGWGKSTYSLAIYDKVVRDQVKLSFLRNGRYLTEAVKEDFPIWRVYASDICNQLQKHAYNDGPEPTVSVKKIKRAAASGWRPRLFIEELDKLGKFTQDRAKHMWEIINTVFDCMGQVVITSNYSQAKFQLEFGGDLYRRVIEDGNGIIMDFFKHPGCPPPTEKEPEKA